MAKALVWSAGAFALGRNAMRYEKRVDPFYKSKKWERMRQRILRRDGYQCQLSKRYGKNRPAEMVHHIFPREDYPQFELSEWNLIALSNAEHNELHDRFSGELTEKGIDLQKRTIRKLKENGKLPKLVSTDPAP